MCGSNTNQSYKQEGKKEGNRQIEQLKSAVEMKGQINDAVKIKAREALQREEQLRQQLTKFGALLPSMMKSTRFANGSRDSAIEVFSILLQRQHESGSGHQRCWAALISCCACRDTIGFVHS